ncbi:MAG TPA: hypothetical protein VMW93_10695 [bacterium]|nr:hypothetical protein [bacterium]
MRTIFTLWALAAILGAAVLGGCGGKREAEAAAGEPGGPADVATPAPGAAVTARAESTPPAAEELLETRCTACHNLERVRKKKETRDGWEEIVDEMVGKGATLDGAEKVAVVDYLAETYGK